MAEQLVLWSAAALLCLSGVILLDIFLQRRWQAAERRREARLRASLLPALSAYLAHDMPLETLLRRIGTERTVIERLLLGLLESLDGDARERVVLLAQVLGLVDSALRELDSADWTLRDNAALKLGALGVQEAVEPLSARLLDRRPEVRYSAARSLGLIGSPAAQSALLDMLDRPEMLDGARVLEIVQSIGDPAPLRMVLHSEDYPLRSRLLAIDLVGDVGDYASVGALTTILNSGESEGAARAVRALGKIGHPGSVYQILGRVGDPSWEVRAQAVKAIGALEIEEGLELLSWALQDQSYWVRRNASEALARFGAVGLAALNSASSGHDGFAQDAARYQLERVRAA